MGNWYSAHFSEKDIHPGDFAAPSHDAHMGFEAPREPRVMKVSNEVLYAMKVPREKRDYCAHIWVDYLKCRRDNFPSVGVCSHIHHDWHQCEYDDHMLRMKEYEREKRLLARAKRKALKANKEAEAEDE